MSARLSAVSHWLEDRIGLGALLDRLLRGYVERRGAWLRTTGLACFVLLLVEGFTGSILGLYYTPSPTAAYQDILAIQQNPMGRFLRGLHHWGSAALILLCGLTLVRMFFGGEYKQRRDIVWIAALLFTPLILFFQLTGHLLPWDTNAAGTADVEAGISGNVWVIGPYIKRFLLGGAAVGGATLTRWYGFHVFLFPAALLLLVALPLFLHRLRQSETDEAPEDSRLSTLDSRLDSYYPVHMAREMTVALAVFLIVAGLAWFGQTPLESAATAENLRNYPAVSEWYVLPLHALLLVPPFNNVAFEPIATVGMPGALVTLLILLPFLDRNPSRRLRERPFALTAGVVVLASTLALCLFALLTEGPPNRARQESAGAAKGGAIALDASLAARGKQVYVRQGCANCHAIAGAGGKSGPDLTRAGARRLDRDWHIAHLRQPTAKVPGSTMPAYGHLKPEELKALAEYLLSLR